MKTIIIATNNQGKAKEFQHLFKNYDVDVKSLKEAGIDIDVEENGTTFIDNAKIKAEAIRDITNTIVIADDSGLVVDALDGRPGVYSARYAGSQRSDSDNIEKVLEELKHVMPENRTARFICALAIAYPISENRETIAVEGKCEGIIGAEPVGNEGFGYDPIFYLPTLGKTMAQIPKSEKSVLSHRADAFSQLSDKISKIVR